MKVGTRSHAKFIICITSHKFILNTSTDFAVTGALNRILGWCSCVRKWYFVSTSTETHSSTNFKCGKVYNSWISLPGSQMPADESQPIRVTEGVNYPHHHHPPPKNPTHSYTQTRTHNISHLKYYHASTQFTMNQKNIKSRDDSFIKCLWISDSDVCRTLPGWNIWVLNAWIGWIVLIWLHRVVNDGLLFSAFQKVNLCLRVPVISWGLLLVAL